MVLHGQPIPQNRPTDQGFYTIARTCGWPRTETSGRCVKLMVTARLYLMLYRDTLASWILHSLSALIFLLLTSRSVSPAGVPFDGCLPYNRLTQRR
jgi:hypothetical protein